MSCGASNASYQRGCRCTLCVEATRAREWRANNPERMREYQDRQNADDRRKAKLKIARASDPNVGTRIHLRDRYGLTLEQRDEILEWQDGRCACCGGVDRDEHRQWHVE